MAKHVTATEARRQFFTLLAIASKPGHSVSISHEGIPKVIMMSQDEFEGWMETLEIMSDPELMAAIRAAEEETETIPLEELDAMIHASGKDVRRHSQAKGRKTTRSIARARPGAHPRRTRRAAQ